MVSLLSLSLHLRTALLIFTKMRIKTLVPFEEFLKVLEKKRAVMRAFATYNFGYCLLVWMFDSSNHLIHLFIYLFICSLFTADAI